MTIAAGNSKHVMCNLCVNCSENRQNSSNDMTDKQHAVKPTIKVVIRKRIKDDRKIKPSVIFGSAAFWAAFLAAIISWISLSLRYSG